MKKIFFTQTALSMLIVMTSCDDGSQSNNNYQSEEAGNENLYKQEDLKGSNPGAGTATTSVSSTMGQQIDRQDFNRQEVKKDQGNSTSQSYQEHPPAPPAPSAQPAPSAPSAQPAQPAPSAPLYTQAPPTTPTTPAPQSSADTQTDGQQQNNIHPLTGGDDQQIQQNNLNNNNPSDNNPNGDISNADQQGDSQVVNSNDNLNEALSEFKEANNKKEEKEALDKGIDQAKKCDTITVINALNNFWKQNKEQLKAQKLDAPELESKIKDLSERIYNENDIGNEACFKGDDNNPSIPKDVFTGWVKQFVETYSKYSDEIRNDSEFNSRVKNDLLKIIKFDNNILKYNITNVGSQGKGVQKHESGAMSEGPGATKPRGAGEILAANSVNLIAMIGAFGLAAFAIAS